MKKIIKQHSDSNWIKSFGRYVLIDDILDSDSWADLEERLKKISSKDCPAIMKRTFNEFKFYNCILGIEYAVTDLLNSFLIKENKIKDWNVLKNKFLEKTKRNIKNTKEEVEEIIKTQINGKIERLLTPPCDVILCWFWRRRVG